MKKQFYKISILAIGLFFVFATNVTAQVDSLKAEKTKAVLMDSICSCLSQTDMSTIKTADDVQTLMQKCLMSNGMLFMNFLTESGVDMSNMSSMQTVVENMMIEFAGKCPAMMKIAMVIAKDSDEYKKMTQGNKDSTQPAKQL